MWRCIAGVAYTLANAALARKRSPEAPPPVSLQWAMGSEEGLPRPDCVFFLDVSPGEASERQGFGGFVPLKQSPS